MLCLSHRGRGVIGLTAWRAQQHGMGIDYWPSWALRWALHEPAGSPGRPPDILKGPDNHRHTLPACSSRAAICALPAQTEMNTSSLLQAMMSVRFLPAVLLPSGDKVVSTPAAARQWVVKVSEGLRNTHKKTRRCRYHAI